jgi:hypothetical protein
MRNLETNVVDVDVGDNAIDDYYKLYMYIHNSDDETSIVHNRPSSSIIILSPLD